MILNGIYKTMVYKYVYKTLNVMQFLLTFTEQKKISTDFEAEATCKFQRANYPLRFIDNITNDFIMSTNDL